MATLEERAPAAIPPDTRRCVSVRVADVPLEQRVEAVRAYNEEWVDDPGERMILFDLGVHPPPDLTAWVARSALTNGSSKLGRRYTREELEELFRLRGQGLTYQACADRLGRSFGSVKAQIQLGKDEALRRHAAEDTRRLASLLRPVLEERLARWQPFNGNGAEHAV